uniref:Uncharacterized protein n=1 Tax=viral metagenome TaxID=1070528 RepID=A0A6C0APW6_9ZZZZ
MGALCTTTAVSVSKGDQIDSVPSTQDISGAQDISGTQDISGAQDISGTQDVSGAPVNQENPSSEVSGSITTGYDTLIQAATVAIENIPNTSVSTQDPAGSTSDIARNIEQYKENVGIAQKL